MEVPKDQLDPGDTNWHYITTNIKDFIGLISHIEGQFVSLSI